MITRSLKVDLRSNVSNASILQNRYLVFPGDLARFVGIAFSKLLLHEKREVKDVVFAFFLWDTKTSSVHLVIDSEIVWTCVEV